MEKAEENGRMMEGIEVRWIKSAIALISSIACFGMLPISAQESPAHTLLIIGDSNTEFGPIANGYASILQANYGKSGSGYIPVNSTYVNLAASKIRFTMDNNWINGDMHFNTNRAQPPYYAPSGLWAESAVPGAKLTAVFNGTGIDVYYSAFADGGVFSVELDGQAVGEVNTRSSKAVTEKQRYAGLADGEHTLVITVVSGRVILSGMDRIAGNTEKGGRAVVHNWGNGASDTTDFLHIEESVFISGIQKLQPDAVVVLLGTNDMVSLDKDAFAKQLTQVVQRVQKATDVPILLVSTFRTYVDTPAFSEYITYSYPAVQKQTGVAYWDMCRWFGNSVANLTESADGVHCNAAAGKRIAAELYNQVQKLLSPEAPPETTVQPPPTGSTTTIATAPSTTESTAVSSNSTVATTAPTVSSSETSSTPTPSTSKQTAPTNGNTDVPAGGFPVWAIVLIAAAAAGAIGTGGFFLWKKLKKPAG